MPRVKFGVKDGISVSSDAVPGGFDLIPPGVMMPYAGSTAPDGWLLCDGSAISRTTYANLFAVLSTTFGSGNGTSTFNIPNTSGRTIVGAGTGARDGESGTGAISGGTALTARALGAWTGKESNTIASTNLPPHTHGVNSHAHLFTITSSSPSSGGPSSNATSTESAGIGSPSPSGTASTSISHSHGTQGNGSHEHRLYFVTDAGSGTARARVSAAGQSLSNYGISEYAGFHSHTVDADNPLHNHDMSDHRHSSDHYHSLNNHTHTTTHGHSGTTDDSSAASTTNGGFANTAVGNVQPMLVLNYIIKY